MATASESGAQGLLLSALYAHPPVIEPADGHTCISGTHSRLSDRRIVCWEPGLDVPVAIDAELLMQPVPAALRDRFGFDGREFWEAWTRTEVVAKLLDVPITTWLSRHGLVASLVWPSGRDRVVQIQVDREDIILAVGLRASAT